MMEWEPGTLDYNYARTYALARTAVRDGTMPQIPAHLRAWREEVIRLGLVVREGADGPGRYDAPGL